jgi:hypothetical protein
MGKRIKENLHRSKLKEQRLMRLKAKHKASLKKRENDEFFQMITQENIDKLNYEEKMKIIKELYNLIISFPESNSDKISLMMLFLKDNSLKILFKVCKLLKNIFINTLPAYRLNNFESKQKESKEIKELHNFERNLLKNYLEFINSIKVLDMSLYKKKEYNQFRIILIEIIGDFFEKFYYFNYEDKLYSILIEKLVDELNEIKSKAFKSLYNVLVIADNSKQMFNLKFSLIKKISNIIFSKDHGRFDKDVLDLFSAHRMEFPDYKKESEAEKKIDLSDLKYSGQLISDKNTKQENKIARKEMKEFNKEKSKIIKSMKKEIRELEDREDYKLIYQMNLKMLKKILLVFFDILKTKPNSPLMGSVFNGISKLCENINVEILKDLQNCIYENIKNLIKNNKFSLAILGLKSNLTIANKLTKEIVSLEDSYLITSSYQILCHLNNEQNKDNLYIIFEVIETILLKNRMYSIDCSSAFVKRLLILAENSKNENIVIAILLLVKRIFSKYSQLSFLIDIDEDNIDNFNYKNMTEPELCNGKLTNIIKELNNIKTNMKGNKTILKIIDYILKEEKVNIELSSLNYYDYLLN